VICRAEGGKYALGLERGESKSTLIGNAARPALSRREREPTEVSEV
jgi:hypothetical protein